MFELSDTFWQEWHTENPHNIFFHPVFWQYLTEFHQYYNEYCGFSIWLKSDAILHSICVLYVITKISISFHLNVKIYTYFAITLMFVPYIWGTYLLFSSDLEPKQLGPIVASMWLTTVYIILPMGYQLIKKIISNNSVNPKLLS
jgi:hypothetical protein